MPEQEAIQQQTMVHIGTRVTSDLEKEISDMAKADRRKISPMVALMLEEYLEVRKIMAGNKLTMPEIINEHDIDSIAFKIIDKSEVNPYLQLIFSGGHGDYAIKLGQETVKNLAANLFTFLIECNLNG